jgi:hypothetical protein
MRDGIPPGRAGATGNLGIVTAIMDFSPGSGRSRLPGAATPPTGAPAHDGCLPTAPDRLCPPPFASPTFALTAQQLLPGASPGQLGQPARLRRILGSQPLASPSTSVQVLTRPRARASMPQSRRDAQARVEHEIVTAAASSRS